MPETNPDVIGKKEELDEPSPGEVETWHRHFSPKVPQNEKSADVAVPQVIDRQMLKEKDRIYSHIWRRFLPAVFAYPMWFYVMVKQDAWVDSFGTYYPLTFAMIFGSMIAGSTPLGGGVVAFPVTVLLIKLRPEQGRDFSLIIQSVGMTAASFLIIYAKRHLCHVWLVLWSLLGGVVGLIVGFEVEMNGFAINVCFTTAVLCFALAFWYRNVVVNRGAPRLVEGSAPDEAWTLLQSSRFNLRSNRVSAFFGKHFPLALTAACCISGFFGGLLTSKLGSGADMLAYIFGVFVWNSSVPKGWTSPLRPPEGAELPDNMLTASSVLIMAGCSVVGTLLRLLTQGISMEVMHCWGACVPIVVLGAPLGSLLLTPKRTEMLRRCFYLCAVVQFVSFALLKIQDKIIAWIGIIGALLAVSMGLGLHYVLSASAVKENQQAAQREANDDAGGTGSFDL